jgi:hypothetical protein
MIINPGQTKLLTEQCLCSIVLGIGALAEPTGAFGLGAVLILCSTFAADHSVTDDSTSPELTQVRQPVPYQLSALEHDLNGLFDLYLPLVRIGDAAIGYTITLPIERDWTAQAVRFSPAIYGKGSYGSYSRIESKRKLSLG